jgi:competence ComEA-like helix-hairpin-helix protein
MIRGNYKMSDGINRVKLNYSSIDELMSLPGIGYKRAQQIVEHRTSHGPFLTLEDLEVVSGLSLHHMSKLIDRLDWSFNGYFIDPPQIFQRDAREIARLLDKKVDLIVTSPPYWQKRDYGHPNQLGQEKTPEAYVVNLCDIVDSFMLILADHGSIFINVGDTFRNSSLIGVPSLLERELLSRKWLIANRIIWSKKNGVPEPKQSRLANRYEVILQLARGENYYADANALATYLEQSANPGDVWDIPHAQNQTEHLAPFPDELVRRIIHFAAPEHICLTCGKPFKRQIEPTFKLDTARPQAKRAIELFEQAGLTEAHLRAIRAVGISDAGKGQKVQTGANGNSEETRQLADEAKRVLGGYFREFTFSRKAQVGWLKCECKLNTRPSIVLDPFMGSGTTIKVAYETGRIGIGSDLLPQNI